MAKPNYGRFVKPGLRDVIKNAAAADRYYAAMFDKEPMAQSGEQGLKPIKHRAASNPDTAEAGVITEIRQLLRVHPSVVLAIRYNSGAAQRPDPSTPGKFIPLHFHTWIKRPEEMLICDFEGVLRDGKPFTIEAKARTWHTPHGERELLQQARIRFIKSIGGLAGFATNAAEAQAIIEGR